MGIYGICLFILLLMDTGNLHPVATVNIAALNTHVHVFERGRVLSEVAFSDLLHSRSVIATVLERN